MNHKHIVLAHGGGGQLTDELVASVVLPRLANEALGELLDAAILPAPPAGHRLAMTTDGYVVSPWRFPGGDIGRLAVCGTVNDLAVCGAKLLGISLSLILAEGFAVSDLEIVIDSIAAAAKEADVAVVTGDTKVVGRNQADGIYIVTAGVGAVPPERQLSPRAVRPGDAILINGPIGEHGLAVMLARHMPDIKSPVVSDAAPLNGLVEALLEKLGTDVVFMRDATRGGLSAVVADLGQRCGRRVMLQEEAIPIRPEALRAASLLGLDPLEIANEGKVVVVVRGGRAEEALGIMQGHRYGTGARVIGRVEEAADALAVLTTRIGGQRIIQKPHGEMLPRIC